MTLISSNWTLVYKWLFPALLLGVAAMMFASGFADSIKWIVLAGGALSLALATQLANEVYDLGDALLVKSPGKNLRIEIRNIMHVHLSMNRPPIVTLHVNDGSKKVRKVRFIPRGTGMLHPYGRGPAQDLMVRVKAAHGNSAA